MPEPEAVDWEAVALPAGGLCTRCRNREAAVALRLFVQERPKGRQAGKTLAGRALRLCEPCSRDVFVYTLAQMERSAAALRDPDNAARDALRYAISHLEADMAGKELCEGIDLDYLRAAAGLG